MGNFGWKPYVPATARRRQAQKATIKARKAGQNYQPVLVSGRTIAKTFWGKAWCDNLEAYSDFENRLPRGRTYLRNGSVIDLRIEAGKVLAQVMGSSLYRVEIGIAALPADRWKTLVAGCTGSIATLVELLQGRFSESVMKQFCQPKTGLFPSPQEIQLQCSCPDWATMCKHIAAVLYGVGARLDEKPELLFTLRQVDASDLVTQVAEFSVKPKKAPAKRRVLDDAALADVFGIDLGGAIAPPMAKLKTPRPSARKAATPKPAAPTKTPKAKAPPAAKSPPTPARKAIAKPTAPVVSAIPKNTGTKRRGTREQ